MYEQTFITLAAEEKGGLFDFGATLPIVMFEFLLLMFILNLILYNPLFTLINKRKEYILNNFTTASETLSKANTLVAVYEEELKGAKKQIQQDIIKSQKLQKQNLEIQLLNCEKSLEQSVEKIANNFTTLKSDILNQCNKEGIVFTLSDTIGFQLLYNNKLK